ncbi:hypothetical protein [Haloferax prahovense]|uniref:hypothetical protein n=1 Tax=Haloferax prahovense TaxID=381852 RepID=UPI001EF9D22F|nr:hypothetical protein [Haloferax prahovense]
MSNGTTTENSFKHRNTKWVGSVGRDNDAVTCVRENTTMAINRRNILIGLGALVGGGGALVGTGAFTTVSAAREVSVSTAGDGSAFLQLTSDSPYVDNTGDTLTLTLDADGNDGNDSGFNENAVTTLTGVFTIANNSAEGNSVQVGLGSGSGPDVPSASDLNTEVTLTVGSDGGEDVEITFTLSETGSNGSAPSLSAGSSVTVDVEIDTTLTSSDADATGELSIFAVDDSA